MSVMLFWQHVEWLLYKFLFTENTVATQKHTSEGINTNKAKTTTKYITVVDTWYWSINKISYKSSLFGCNYRVVCCLDEINKSIDWLIDSKTRKHKQSITQYRQVNMIQYRPNYSTKVKCQKVEIPGNKSWRHCALFVYLGSNYGNMEIITYCREQINFELPSVT